MDELEKKTNEVADEPTAADITQEADIEETATLSSTVEEAEVEAPTAESVEGDAEMAEQSNEAELTTDKTIEETDEDHEYDDEGPIYDDEDEEEEEIENVPAEDEDEFAKQEKKLSRRKRRKLAKRERMLTWERGKDIRYRGPLSYRSIRIVAFIALFLSQAGVLINIGSKYDAAFAENMRVWSMILPFFANIITPMFLVATFATILNNSRKFSSLLITYGGFSVIVYLLFILIQDRFAVGLVMRYLEVDRSAAVGMIQSLLTKAATGGYLSFNIFVDLFLCTLFTFFVVYRPKKIFVGKWLIAFRLMALLPVACEILAILAKVMSSTGHWVLSTYVYPLLTTKPPVTFVVFIILTFYIKKREWLFRRGGKTHEDYQAFLGSNLNSLQFSMFTSVLFIIAGIVDFIICIVVADIMSLGPLSMYADAPEKILDIVMSWGLGDGTVLMLVAPLLMLFSYTRAYKDTKMDIFIPVIAVIAIVLLYMEGLYQALLYFGDMFQGLVSGIGAGG